MSQCNWCDMEIEFDDTRTNQKGGVFPIEKKTGIIHNCIAKLHEGIKKLKPQYRRAGHYWEPEEIEFVKDEFLQWKNEYEKRNFPNSTQEDRKKWIVRVPEAFLNRISKKSERTPNAIKLQLEWMGLIEN